METVSVILFVIVLLMQVALFILFFFERRRNIRRYNAVMNYIDRAIDGTCATNEAVLKDFREILNAKIKSNEEFINFTTNSFLKTIDEKLKLQSDSAQKLEARVAAKVDELLLDYAQAQEAAGKINSFAGSLSAIFDYDPIKAIQKGRKKEAG